MLPGYMERFNKSLAREAVAEYAAIAQKYGITPTQLALAFCKSRWFVASTIIGATSLPQLKVRTTHPPNYLFNLAVLKPYSCSSIRAWNLICMTAPS